MPIALLMIQPTKGIRPRTPPAAPSTTSARKNQSLIGVETRESGIRCRQKRDEKQDADVREDSHDLVVRDVLAVKLCCGVGSVVELRESRLRCILLAVAVALILFDRSAADRALLGVFIHVGAALFTGCHDVILLSGTRRHETAGSSPVAQYYNTF